MVSAARGFRILFFLVRQAVDRIYPVAVCCCTFRQMLDNVRTVASLPEPGLSNDCVRFGRVQACAQELSI